MKSSDEMVNSLFERREKYVVEQKRKQKIITGIAFSIGCLCLVTIIGFGGRKSGWFSIKLQVTINDSKISVHSTTETDSGKNSLVEWKGKTISEYDSVDTASYSTPDNNKFGLSIPLRSAIEEYGDSVKYMVVVDFFKDKEEVAADESILQAEMVRLNELGYNAFIEANDSGAEPANYFFIEASKEQLENFDCNEDYGYFFFIKSERVQ